MKYMKMLGLALVAAAALMAFVGAGTASATVLCKVNTLTTGCAAGGQDYPAGTVIDASLSGSASLKTTGGSLLDTCTGGTVKGTTSNTGSSTETVKGPITWKNEKGETINGLTWSGCTKETKTLTPGELEIHWISGTDNGTLTAKNTQVTVNGLFENESCIYGAGTGIDLGTLTGGNPATITINALVPRQTGSGFLCPAEARWEASYTVTEPKPLYVSTS